MKNRLTLKILWVAGLVVLPLVSFGIASDYAGAITVENGISNSSSGAVPPYTTTVQITGGVAATNGNTSSYTKRINGRIPKGTSVVVTTCVQSANKNSCQKIGTIQLNKPLAGSMNFYVALNSANVLTLYYGTNNSDLASAFSSPSIAFMYTPSGSHQIYATLS